METKQKVYGIRQAVWGADHPKVIYFDNKEAQENYYNSHNDYCIGFFLLKEDNSREYFTSREDIFTIFQAYKGA